MHKEKLNIPKEHSLIQTKTEWKQKRAQDTDIYWYDELNAEGEVIAKYIVKDSTSIHPPFDKKITF